MCVVLPSSPLWALYILLLSNPCFVNCEPLCLCVMWVQIRQDVAVVAFVAFVAFVTFVAFVAFVAFVVNLCVCVYCEYKSDRRLHLLQRAAAVEKALLTPLTLPMSSSRQTATPPSPHNLFVTQIHSVWVYLVNIAQLKLRKCKRPTIKLIKSRSTTLCITVKLL